MTKKTILCEHCEASFSLRYDMDDDYFRPKYCPFCGDDLPEEDEFSVLEEDDNEWNIKKS